MTRFETALQITKIALGIAAVTIFWLHCGC